MDHACRRMASPVGALTLVARGDALCAVLWQDERAGRVPLSALVEDPQRPVLLAAQAQLDEYFAGTRNRFDLPLHFEGTEFQKKVWAALLQIPYGQTRTYLEIARQLGNEKAVRAVGAANGRNPISIIAPCHRVIGARGELTGFAGGLHAKKLLLGIEGIATEGHDAGQTIDPRRRAQHRRREDDSQLALW